MLIFYLILSYYKLLNFIKFPELSFTENLFQNQIIFIKVSFENPNVF